MNQQRINALRKDAVFVNVARADLVDYEALTARLKQNDLFAALDVFDQEPLGADSELRTLPNAYLTPHRAGGLMVSVERIVSGSWKTWTACLRRGSEDTGCGGHDSFSR